jgi:hypothetical protein
LAEGGEQPRERVRRYPGAGVLDVDRQTNPGRVAVRVGTDAYPDAARFGEFQRVADEVDQDLPQPARVDDDQRGRAGREVAAERQLAVLGARLELAPEPLEERPEVDRDRRQLEPAGVDPAEVQDVVDDGQQHLGRFDRGLDVAALLRVERRVAQQPAHADDPVHRLANLVAHHREESAARA